MKSKDISIIVISILVASSLGTVSSFSRLSYKINDL